jgi:RHS repeat-associated protein
MNAMMRLACIGSAMLLFVSSIAQAVVAQQLIDSHDYEYDAVSNIVERTTGGITTTFDYDLVGQLIAETRNGYSASYTYDANGNRLTRTVNNVTEEYEYDGADKLLEVSINQQAVKEFTYDAAGRTTSITTSAGTTTLSWDYEDRLIGITYPSTATNSFSYNAFGARVGKTDSSGTSTYVRNGVSVVAPVLSDGSLNYTPGISSRDGTNSTWSHGDIKNSLRQSAANESTSATKHYDAFGNETTSTGTWQGPFQYGGNFGYQTDEDSGLKLLGHRYYDSSTGRFISRDSAKDGRNWFTYCSSSPVSAFDDTGFVGRKISDDEMVDVYAKFDAEGKYMKPGRSLNHETRYSRLKLNGGRTERLDRVPYKDAKVLERQLEEHLPGPETNVKWGGSKLNEPVPLSIRKYVRKIGRWAKPLLLLVLLFDGPEAAARDLVWADEVEAGSTFVKEALDPHIDDASKRAGSWYRKRSGFSDSELAEYGLDY